MKNIQDFLSDYSNRNIVGGGIAIAGLVGGALCATLLFTPFTAVSFVAFTYISSPFTVIASSVATRDASLLLNFIGLAAAVTVAAALFATTTWTVPVVLAAFATSVIINGVVSCIYHAANKNYDASALHLNVALGASCAFWVGAALFAFTPLNISVLFISALALSLTTQGLNVSIGGDEKKVIQFVSEGISGLFDKILAPIHAPDAAAVTPDGM